MNLRKGQKITLRRKDNGRYVSGEVIAVDDKNITIKTLSSAAYDVLDRKTFEELFDIVRVEDE